MEGTLLENLLKLGYGVPSPCGGKATCYQCKVQVVEGGGEPQDIETMIFSNKKVKEGWRLSCQCKIKGPVKIHMDPSAMNVSAFKGKVLSNKNVSTFIKELCIEISEQEKVSYIPGDYMQVHVPPFKIHTKDWKGGIEKHFHSDWEKFSMLSRELHHLDDGEMRAYSLASHPLEGNILKFTIRIATPPFKGEVVHPRIFWGIGSSYIFSLKEGDDVEVSGPYGESHMIDDDRELVFLIGGAGASFARSHILDLFFKQRYKEEGNALVWSA